MNADIFGAECSENRLSRYACPESCPFNPFATARYPDLLAVENDLDLASMKRLVRDAPAVTDVLVQSGHPETLGWQAEVMSHLFFVQDGSGRTLGQRWEQAGFPGLKNDERVFFRGKMQVRVALLEVRCVLDALRLEVVDLLDPNPRPLIVVDRSIAARAVRFSSILGWLYPLPHFWRLTGAAVALTDVGTLSPGQMFEAYIAHLGGPVGRNEQQRWLAKNFGRVNDAMVATGAERRRRMLAQIDGTFGAATYKLQAPFAACRNALRAEPEIEEDEIHADERQKGFTAAMVWFEAQRRGGAASPITGNRVMGRILLGPKEWRLEAMGAARLDELRARFEARLGPRVRFLKERRDNIAGKLAAGEPAPQLALVPPQLLEQPDMLDLAPSRVAGPPAGVSVEEFQAELLRSHREAWVDQSLPALKGRTPREAATMPGLQSRLLELVKAQVRQVDQMNLETGRADDANAFIRELGLFEIDFPAPPPRSIPPEPDHGDEEDFDDPPDAPPPRSFADLESGSKRTGSSMSDAPMSFNEAVRRLRLGIDAFKTASEALEEMQLSGAELIDAAHQLASDDMDEEKFALLTVFLMQVWYALVPRRRRVSPLRVEVMAKEVRTDEAELAKGGALSSAIFERVFARSPQPHLLEAVVATVGELAQKGPKSTRPDADVALRMMLVLKAVIAEIDYALRRP